MKGRNQRENGDVWRSIRLRCLGGWVLHSKPTYGQTVKRSYAYSFYYSDRPIAGALSMLSYLWSGVTCESEGGQAQDRHTLSRWER